ncbi:helix-turn-helix domain-containing protein [Psychrobacillus sp. FSL K6-2684]|uniref:winged helix-turn-helix domain-containing protein n=1 Tax=unclassified Psychrobacillus TaxID=2636677 RepID=UPI0030F8A0D5
MKSYVAVLTKNDKIYNFLEVVYNTVVPLRLITDLNSSKDDNYCIAFIWDFSTYDDLSQITPEFNKPIILLSSLLNENRSYLELHQMLTTYFPLLDKIEEDGFYDLFKLTDDSYFSIEKHSVITTETTHLLTNLEFRLLYYLLKNEGKAISVNTLMERLDLLSPSSLYVCIKKLRQKIEKDISHPSLLVYHKNLGYSLNIYNINNN